MHVIPVKELLRLSVQVRSDIHQCQCDQFKNQWNCHQLWHLRNCNSFSSNANSIVGVIVFQAMQIQLLAQSVQLYSQVQSNTYKHLHYTKNVSSVITGYAIMWVCNQRKYSLSGRWSTCNQMTVNARTSRWPPNATVNRLCTQCNCTHFSNQHAYKMLVQSPNTHNSTCAISREKISCTVNVHAISKQSMQVPLDEPQRRHTINLHVITGNPHSYTTVRRQSVMQSTQMRSVYDQRTITWAMKEQLCTQCRHNPHSNNAFPNDYGINAKLSVMSSSHIHTLVQSSQNKHVYAITFAIDPTTLSCTSNARAINRHAHPNANLLRPFNDKKFRKSIVNNF